MAKLKFNDFYKLDEATTEVFILNAQTSKADEYHAGVYNSGLLTLIGDDFSGSIVFDSWSVLKNKSFVAFAFTAFGDFFIYDKKTELVSLFEPQFTRLTAIEIDVETFFGDFLLNDGIVQNLLKKDYLNKILEYCSPSHYGECFILTPWRALGGIDTPENYKKGGFAVYVDLVGQSLSKQ